MFSLPELVLIGIAYLTFLFGAAWLTERGKIPARIVRHPYTHVLSLGVYASVWTYYGTFGLAEQGGYMFLVSYLGAAAAFMLAPAFLIPILRITRTYQLSSLADLFAFRFRSGTLGTITALLTVVATLPLISIQISAVSDAVHIISAFAADQIALGFCIVIAVFSILFGARHASLRSQNPGLMVAMAVESLIKLGALLVIGLYCFFELLGGGSGLEAWLATNPQATTDLYNNVDSGLWRSLLLAFFSSAVLMPHMFHMMFTENTADETLYKATWGMPLMLFLMALVVPIILWSGQAMGVGGNPQNVMFYLGLQLDSEWLTVLTFIGGLSAATGIMIVATVSMASTLQNHLILPLIPLPDTTRFYAWLLWLRRLLIMMLTLASYLLYQLVTNKYDLHQLGIVTVFAFLQFLPALLVTLFWPRANRWGVISGLCVGMTSWLLTMLLPLFDVSEGPLIPFQLAATEWDITAMTSLFLNSAVMICVSLMTPSTPEEKRAANACLVNALQQTNMDPLQARRLEDFVQLLTPRLGNDAASREVQSAADILNLPGHHMRPIDLLRLRSQLEQNLSGLLGPVEAASLLEPLHHQGASVGFKAHNVHLMESQLEDYQEKMTGLTAELDQLRRYHRLTLQKLPIGVCTLDGEQQILLWNAEMARFTDLVAEDCVGVPVNTLPPPWGEVLGEFASHPDSHVPDQKISLKGATHWCGLHKAQLSEHLDAGTVILLEDETDTHLMQQNLAHSERLASIGRFAAGVAHEIGNPVTGIACLAQNLKLETDNSEILETGDQIVGQTKRIGSIVDSLVRFAHAGRQEQGREHRPVLLRGCVEEAIHLISLDTRGKQQSYINDVPASLTVSGNSQQLLQIFVNLLNNASDASELYDHIWVDAEEDEGVVVVTITDEGSGIAPELQQQLFEPFFTTKEPGKGTGLGLTLVYNIVEDHYGSIDLISPANNKQNKGTQVVITLPGHIPAVGRDTSQSEHGEGL